MNAPPFIPALYMVVLSLSLCACSGTSQDERDAAHPVAHKIRIDPLPANALPDSPTSTRVTDNPGLANPAARKCVDDGYRLEYPRADGVPIKRYCANDATGAKCES